MPSTSRTRPLPRLVLASGSPRRIEILRRLGLDPVVRPANIDESPRPDEEPESYALRLAREKARARTAPGELVLGADTIVVLEGDLLGKPGGPADAREMLARLAGRTHIVVSGVALYEPATERGVESTTTTRVRMSAMTADEIAWYVDAGEPLDKAGSYAVQGLGALFVHSIDGNHSNVVGLPLPLVYRLFRELGYDLRDFRAL